MVGDENRKRVVLFGGALNEQVWNDTWEWDGSTWSQRHAAISPPARTAAALAYDSGRRRTVLFGGMTGGTNPTPLGDTWEWDGSAWNQVATQTSPVPRSRHALAYDAVRRCTVLFGGMSSSILGDTWEWDGATWREVNVSGPTPRYSHVLAWHEDRQRVVLQGGFRAGCNAESDTWEWDGVGWTLMSTGTGHPRVYHSAVYDSERRRLVTFGGMTGGCSGAEYGTWVYGDVTSPAAVSFGSGCAGQAGVPELASVGEPVLGRSHYALDCVRGLPESFVIVGFSVTSADIPPEAAGSASTPRPW
jgi:hypothetical protein